MWIMIWEPLEQGMSFGLLGRFKLYSNVPDSHSAQATVHCPSKTLVIISKDQISFDLSTLHFLAP